MKKRLFSWKDPKPAKKAAVIRYGAIGDAVQTSSLFPLLKAEGYHVTLYCQSGPGYEALLHDPHIDRFIVQDKDAVPPQFLQEFWDATKVKYDKWINLCECVEGTLLAIPGRANHEWPDEVRAVMQDRNYLEFMHDIAGLPHVFAPRFYSTLEERAWARKQVSRFGGRNVLWSLAGSSGHKTWPWLDQIIARLMTDYTDVDVTLVGDNSCQILEAGWEAEPRVHRRSGIWSIRESLAFAESSDLVIGTETGLLNAVGHSDIPKIITISHSSEEMLTKHWRNVTVLKQPMSGGCSKFPCRQLHYTWDYCNQDDETGAAVCQSSISADVMWDAVVRVLGEPKRMAA
jgi:ADP-heptose:LPS heptosyltransferase